MERGGCIETITPLLEAAARVINDRIGRELFIFIIDRLALLSFGPRSKRDRRNIFDSSFSLFNKFILDWRRM